MHALFHNTIAIMFLYIYINRNLELEPPTNPPQMWKLFYGGE